MKNIFKSIIILASTSALNAQTTTTITGSLKVNDSLQVSNNINSAGNIKADGEVVSKDTMRAQKDVIVDGNVNIGNDLKVEGTTNLRTLNVGGKFIINTPAPLSLDPCLKILMAQQVTGGQEVVALTAAQITGIENAIDNNSCPTPPVIPFTWQTYGNHVNSNQRWIGTFENYDFNIKTNNTFQIVCKANGDIGLGAFGGNVVNTTNKKYRLFISNTGVVNMGMQDANNRYPFTVKANGATTIGIQTSTVAANYMLNVNGAVNIGTTFLSSAPYMLTVNGRIGAREIKVSIQNPWPDYVFSNTYKLQTLENIEKYISKNNHLPNIPSAEELKVEECGLDIAKMQGMQMEKIEEIYLHLIDLDKQLKELKKENELLKQLLLK